MAVRQAATRGKRSARAARESAERARAARGGVGAAAARDGREGERPDAGARDDVVTETHVGTKAPKAATRKARAQKATPDPETALRAKAARSKRLREGFSRYDALVAGTAMSKLEFRVRHGMSARELAERFVAVIDERWLPIVLRQVERGAAAEEGDERVVPGMVLALGHLCADWQTFRAHLRRIGTQRFGTERRRELALAASRYDEPEPRAALLKSATAWVSQVNDWARTVSDVAYEVLVARGDAAARPLMAKVLELATYGGSNYPMAVFTAEMAGEHGVEACGPGLLRAVESGLGRLEDGSRGRIVAALAKVVGDPARPLLRRLYDDRVAQWEAERGDAARYLHHHDHACALLRGLLRLRPLDDDVVDKAREILAMYGGRAELDTANVHSLAALVRGVREGGVRALGPDVAAFAGKADQLRIPGELRGALDDFLTESLSELGA